MCVSAKYQSLFLLKSLYILRKTLLMGYSFTIALDKYFSGILIARKLRLNQRHVNKKVIAI